MTETTRKGLLKLICYYEPCGSCILAHYDCLEIPAFVLVGIVGENRNSLLRKYWSMPDRIKKQENIQAAFVYLSGAKMK